MEDQSRNVDPTPEAVVAMYIYAKEYAHQKGGSMDFWDRLDASRRRVCYDMLSEIQLAIEAHS